MNGHSFFLKLTDYRLHFCNKIKKEIFDHFRLYSTLKILYPLSYVVKYCFYSLGAIIESARKKLSVPARNEI